MTYDEILTRFDVHEINQGHAMARCPAHADGRPSLHISQGRSGNTVLKCFAQCQTLDILAAVGLKLADLYDTPKEQPKQERRVDATYPYVDEHGELLYEVVRYMPKGFMQRRPDGQGGWSYKLGDVRRVLYRLPELALAIERGEPVWVVEGEKDVQALEDVGEWATTACGGAGKWRAEYNAMLKGAHVIVCGDNDDTGRRHAVDVATQLLSTAASVEHRRPADGFKDIAEQLGAGVSLDACITVTDTTEAEPEQVDPTADLTTAGMAVVLAVRTTQQILDMPAPEFLIDGFIVDGSLACIYGKPATFKSFIAQSWAYSFATGKEWYGRDVVPSRVLYVAAEGASGIGKRTRAWCQSMGIRTDELDDLMWLPMAVNLLNDDKAAGLIAAAIQHEADIVFIDTVARSLPGANENESVPFSKLVAVADALRQHGMTVILIHHQPKSGEGMRGHTNLEGAVDTALETTRSGNIVTLAVTKQKDFTEDEPTRFELRQSGESAVLTVLKGSGTATDAQLPVMRAVWDSDGTGITAADIAKNTGKAKSTVNRHINELIATGLIRNIAPNGVAVYVATDTDEAVA